MKIVIVALMLAKKTQVKKAILEMIKIRRVPLVMMTIPYKI